jgi:hypothetical protein
MKSGQEFGRPSASWVEGETASGTHFGFRRARPAFAEVGINGGAKRLKGFAIGFNRS